MGKLKIISMKTKDAKIQFATFYKMIYKNNEEGIDSNEEYPFYEVKSVIEYILKLTIKKRFYDLKSDKFCFLDNINFKENLISGCVKSARNEFRPNIINKNTGEERKNPKTKLDGEIEKTHFVIRVDRDAKEVYLFLESNFYGISVLNLANYFNKFSKDYAIKNKLSTAYALKYSMIGINNFKTELERFVRSKVAEIYYEKQILGNDFLNLTDRLIPVKEDVIVTVKAEKGMDIQKIALKAFDLLESKKDNCISRVRIKGNDEYGNESTIDTGIMVRKEFVKSKIDEETGEFDTEDLIKQIVNIANSF